MTNTFREDIAIGVSANLERDLAQIAETLQSRRDRAVGAIEAHTLAQERIEALFAHGDKLLEASEITQEQRVAWKRALQLAHGALESLKQTQDVSVHEIDGQIKAYGEVLRVVGKHKGAYTAARDSINAEAARLEQEEADRLAAQEARDADRARRAEEAAEAARVRAAEEEQKANKRLAPAGTKALRERILYDEDGNPIPDEHAGEPVGRRTSDR